MPSDGSGRPSLASRARPWLGVFVAGLVFALAFGAFLTVRTVRATFLDDEFYDDALDENEIYDRVYTELLADPGLSETLGNLLADLPVEPSLQVAAVRLVLPPDRVQEVVEALVDQIVAYLRDEHDFIGSDIGLSELYGEIEAQATAWMQEQVAALPPETIETVDELQAQARDFAGALAEGEVPDELPIADQLPVDTQQVTDTIVSAIDGAVDPETAELIEAEVAAGDLDGAFVVATSEFLDPYLAENVSDIQQALDGENDVSLFELFTGASGESGERVLDEFDTVRGIARWFSPGVGNAALAVMALALIAVGLLARRRGLRPMAAIAGVLLVTGFVAFTVVGVAGLVVDGPLDEAVRSGVDGWGLPGPLRDMLSDVRGTLGSELFDELRRSVTTVITADALATVAALLLAGRFGDLAERGPRNRAIASAAVVGLVIVAFGTVSFGSRSNPANRGSATATRSSATGPTTRSCSPRATTRCRALTSPSSGPSTTSGSPTSWSTGCACCSSTPTTGRARTRSPTTWGRCLPISRPRPTRSSTIDRKEARSCATTCAASARSTSRSRSAT